MQMTELSSEEKKSYIVDALYEHKGLQHVVNAAAMVLGNPVFVNDRSLKVLARSHVGDEEIWSSVGLQDYFEIEALREVESAGIYAHLFQSDEPIYGSFDFSANRFLGCRIRDKEGPIGFATIVEKRPIQKEDEELLVFFCKTLFYEFLYMDRTAMQRNPAYKLLEDLIESRISREEAENRAIGLGVLFPSSMCVLVLKYQESKQGLSVHYVYQVLASAFPAAQVIIYKERIVLLMDTERCKEEAYSFILTSVGSLPVSIGVSRAFEDFMELGTAFRQAEAAIRINRKMGIPNRICRYDDLLVYELFEAASKEGPLSDFYDPAVLALERYDRENGSCLLETAKVYLECWKNTQRAKDKLFIHKNTLYYRLQRIEEVCGISFENTDTCFNMQMTFRMIQFDTRKS